MPTRVICSALPSLPRNSSYCHPSLPSSNRNSNNLLPPSNRFQSVPICSLTIPSSRAILPNLPQQSPQKKICPPPGSPHSKKHGPHRPQPAQQDAELQLLGTAPGTKMALPAPAQSQKQNPP